MCDEPSIWDPQERTARKRHACEECSDPILPGERYTRVGALYEGGWETLRLHPHCLEWAYALNRWSDRAEVEFCWEIGSLQGALKEAQEWI